MFDKYRLTIENSLKEQLLNSFSPKDILEYKLQLSARKLLGKHTLIAKPWFFWINAQYALGILSSGQPSSITCLVSFYDKVLHAKKYVKTLFDMPDNLLHAYILLQLYIKYEQKQYYSLIQSAAEFISSEAKKYAGLIPYRASNSWLYIDSMGMITDFCYIYGKEFHENSFIELANHNLSYLAARCKEEGSILPYQSYNLVSNEHSGSATWGRGACWYLWGLTSAVCNGNTNFISTYISVINLIFECQDSAGYLYDDTEKRNHIDTSTTSMAAYCLALGIEHGILSIDGASAYKVQLKQAVIALLQSTDEAGHVNDCSGECGKAGAYSASFGNYFAQGYTLALLNLIDSSSLLKSLFG